MVCIYGFFCCNFVADFKRIRPIHDVKPNRGVLAHLARAQHWQC